MDRAGGHVRLSLRLSGPRLDGEAQKAARALLDFVQEQHCQRDLFMAYAFCGQLTLLQDGAEVAEPWLAMAGDQEELVGPMTSLEVLAVTRAWILLAKGGEANVAHQMNPVAARSVLREELLRQEGLEP